MLIDRLAINSRIFFPPAPAVVAAAAGLLAAIAILACSARPGYDIPPLPKIFENGIANICTTQAASVATQANEQRPRAVPEVISTEKLSHIPGRNISVVRVRFPPGGFSPKHYHGGSVTIYVLSGSIRSQLEGGPAVTYGPGETFFEPFGAIHLFAENTSTTEPADVLAVFVHDEGATLTTYF